MSSEEEKPKDERRRGDFLGISAIAAGLLSGLASEKLSQSLDSTGWIRTVGFSLTALFVVIWGIYNAPVLLRKYRRWRAGAAAPSTPSELQAAAEEAEQWLVALGSESGGLAAAEWFQQNEPRLRELLVEEKPVAATADDLARICDALDAWYVRQGHADDLLQISIFLLTVAEGTGRHDLEELATARQATAYRLLNDLGTAITMIAVSANISPAQRERAGRTLPGRSPHSRTGAAVETRRQVESALINLARADSAPVGNERNEAVAHARSRLDDARLSRPGPDLAADVAISINLAIVQLYQEDGEGALELLTPALARAAAAADRSAQAHVSELIGVAAWMLKRPDQAERWWGRAEHLYSEIDEREGQARCLQHLGSAAVVAGDRAGGKSLLQQSAVLRRSESPLLKKYLDAATQTTPAPVEPSTAPRPISWLRHKINQWRLR
ncbi:hypothetical protein [Kribbella sp. NPDC051770]|uniref:hypothetical protein n=1 Tax=Kribbella sp. NPDC051770 TaxID=3155413 RepID=UPI00342AAD88